MFVLADRVLFEDRSISTFLKSWLVFYSFGLKDELYRDSILNGLKPWDRIQSLNHIFDPVWTYNPGFCFDENDRIPLEECVFEWETFIEKWSKHTLFNPYYEVVLTTNGRGLGLRSKLRRCFRILSDNVDGFLEFITEEMFQFLTVQHYRSLYTYTSQDV